jgi:G3E family GTPase
MQTYIYSHVHTFICILLSDAKLIKRTEEKMIEMSNGCICCNLREDLLEQLAEIAKENATDYIVIESTGIAEPVHIAETFAHAETLDHVKGLIRLDTMITVVDMQTFFQHFNDNVKMYNSGGGVCVGVNNDNCKNENEEEELAVQQKEQPAAEDRTLSHLLVDQVQFADIVVLNKMDCVTPETVSDITGIVRDLNPLAKIMTSSYENQIDPLQFINTNLFSYEKAEENAQWFAEDWADGAHVPESEEYGIGSINFTSQDRPFHPARLMNFFESMTSKVASTATPSAASESKPACKLNTTEVTHSKYGRLLRSKGFVWLATRHDRFWLLHHTGGSLNLQRGGKWWAEVDSSKWPGQGDRERRNREKEELTMVEKSGAHGSTKKSKKRCRLEKEEREDEFYQEVIKRINASKYGDRAQTLVLIGQHLDKEGVRQLLQSCLLTDEELALGPDGWLRELEDPLPRPVADTQASQDQTGDHSHDHSHSHSQEPSHDNEESAADDCNEQSKKKARNA